MSAQRKPAARLVGKLIDRLHTAIFIPAFETGLKRRPIFAYWKQLEHSQWLSAETIAAMQLAALQRLVEHSWNTSPWYRAEWTLKGLSPASLQTLADLRHWPILGKQELRNHRSEIRSTAPGLSLLSKATSGSTGEPFTIEYDTGSFERRMAAWFRGYHWAGAAPGVKQFYFWGASPLPRTRRARWKEAFHHQLYRRVLENSLAFADAQAPAVFARYEKAKPAVVVAFARPLYELCRLFKQLGLRPTPPQSIVVGAEKLHDFQRQLIEEVFGAPVFETYGCREFMLIAAECDQHKGMHLTAEHLVVEVVDDRGQPVAAGVEGRLVVTDLYNYGAPYIRYDTGDRAVASDRRCACGRGLPMLEKVVGRSLEVVLTPDGRRIPGEGFVVVLKEIQQIRRYQVAQTSAERLTVRIEPGMGWTDDTANYIRECLTHLVGRALALDIEILDRIPESASGKLMLVSNPWLQAQRSGEARP